MREFLKRAWHFIWNDDSLLSWIVNVILAFIIVKFLIYPGIGLLFGTDYPLVAVVSCSMEHNINFDSWWETNKAWYESNGISREQFSEFPFKNGINQGDIMVLKNRKEVNTGDVIVFAGGSSNPIIHRVVEELSNGFVTKGDHNSIPDGSTNNVIGEAFFRIPYLGWIKILFNALIGQGIIRC